MPDPVAAHGLRTTALRLSSAIGKLGLHGKIGKVFADSRDTRLKGSQRPERK